MVNLGANLGAKPVRILRSLAVAVVAAGLLGACASSSGSDRQLGYAPSAGVASSQVGTASWYGGKFHGRRTASGERYNMHALTAAHRSLRPRGALAIWSIGTEGTFERRLRKAGFNASTHPVRGRGHRGGHYSVLVGRRP